MGYGKTITQEGTRVIGGGSANRIIFGGWMIASFFFMNFVTGYLKTGLLVQLPYPRLRTIEDIVSRPDLKPMMSRISAAVFKVKPPSIETLRGLIEIIVMRLLIVRRCLSTATGRDNRRILNILTYCIQQLLLYLVVLSDGI